MYVVHASYTFRYTYKGKRRDEKVDISRGEAVRQELVLAVQASHWMKDEEIPKVSTRSSS